MNGITVLGDGRDAAPADMRAGLKELVSYARDAGQPARTWAVLGEMAGLPANSVVEHDAIGRLAVRLDVTRLVVVGVSRPARAMHQGAVMEGSWGEESVLVPDPAAAIALLDAELAPGDIVAVMSAHEAGVWAVAELLLGGGAAAGPRGDKAKPGEAC